MMRRLPGGISIATMLLCLPAAFVSVGCEDVVFDRRSLIKDWRGLAVVVDKPVIRPGEDVRFDAYIVDPDGARAMHLDPGVQFQWRACLRAESTPGLSGLQFNPASAGAGCGDMDALPLEIEEDGRALLRGTFTDRMIETAQLQAAAEALGFPPEFLLAALERVGISIAVELTVRSAGQVVVQGFKRVILTTGDWTGENPPPPSFLFGEIQVSGDAGFVCTPAAPLVLAPSERVILNPADLPLDAEDPGNWLERYEVLDIEGNFVEINEAAYYSWFSTAGNLDQQVTKFPADEEIFIAPALPGDYPLYMFVRDGHGGTSGCRTEFQVQ